MSITFLCGMPSEKDVLQRVFPGFLVLSGTDKLNLSLLVPNNCTRIVVSGLFGGLAPGIPVGGVCLANEIVDQAGDLFTCDPEWNLNVTRASKFGRMSFGLVKWYSSGILDQADTALQRKAIFEKYDAKAIDDEARYAVAEAKRRHIACNEIRSCSDDYSETLPMAARGAIMTASGGVDYSYLLKEILSEPAYQTVDLVKIGMDFGKSLATLEYALNAVKGAVLS